MTTATQDERKAPVGNGKFAASLGRVRNRINQLETIRQTMVASDCDEKVKEAATEMSTIINDLRVEAQLWEEHFKNN